MSNLTGSAEDQDSSTTFVRQRRDIFVISAFLLVAQIADLEPTHLSFLGIEVDVHNSKILIYALWALWIYWLLRYFQAFINLPKQVIRAAYKAEVVTLVGVLLKKREWERVKKLVAGAPENAGAVVRPPQIGIFLGVDGNSTYGWNPDVRLDGKQIEWLHEKVDITNVENLIANILATVSLCFRRIEVTEYLFPFVFGISPALYFVYSHFLK